MNGMWGGGVSLQDLLHSLVRSHAEFNIMRGDGLWGDGT